VGPHRLTAALALIALAGCSGGGASTSRSAERATVARVVDGDTLRLAGGGLVRLVQVDAPERGAECWGVRAAGVLAQLAPAGTRVELERDPELDDRDRFGRRLRYVRRDGGLLNLELVERGAAAPYFYRGRRGRHADELLRAAHSARAARLGLWGACPSARLDPPRALDAGPG
jgi:micrococcal nuclease